MRGEEFSSEKGVSDGAASLGGWGSTALSSIGTDTALLDESAVLSLDALDDASPEDSDDAALEVLLSLDAAALSLEELDELEESEESEALSLDVLDDASLEEDASDEGSDEAEEERAASSSSSFSAVIVVTYPSGISRMGCSTDVLYVKLICRSGCVQTKPSW